MSQQQKPKKKRYLLKGTDKYDKISYRDKIMLIKKVIIDNEQIKEVALTLYQTSH